MDDDEQRAFARRIEIGRLVEDAFDRGTVWLFHETTSSVLVVRAAVCVFMSVSFFGLASVAAATNTSGTDLASAPRNATRDPSRESVKLIRPMSRRGKA